MIVTNLLTLHNQIKIHHWQTKNYAEHKALDDAYGELGELIDQFVEILMGKYGRIHNKNGFVITLKNYEDVNMNEIIDSNIDYLMNELTESIEETDTDLLNIRDEMVGVLNKLKYLLTLQ